MRDRIIKTLNTCIRLNKDVLTDTEIKDIEEQIEVVKHHFKESGEIMNKKTFKIPVEWASYGIVEIEANTLEDAIKIFDKTEDEISLLEGDYIDGSFTRGKQSQLGNAEEDIEYYKLFN